MTTEVWQDEPFVHVALQVRDQKFNVRTLTTLVSIRIIGNTAMLQKLAAVPVAECRVSGSSTSGDCSAKATLPTEWFEDIAGSVSIEYGFSGGSMESLGTVAVHATPKYTVDKNVVLVLPQHNVMSGRRYVVEAIGHAGLAISTFTLRFDVGVGLAIRGITTDPKWSAIVVPKPGSSQSSGVQALLAAPESAPSGAVNPEVLARVEIEVVAATGVSFLTDMNITIEALTDIRTEKVRPNGLGTPTPGTVVDRDGVSATRP